ncbi:STAS domain-containing protein [Micromonospora chokoriensis]
MSLTWDRDGSLSTVSVVGDIDMSNAHLLTELVEFLCRTPTPLIAVDLSAVRFFGAHGVSALLRARHLAERAGGRLTLHDPSPFVRRVLGVAGVIRHLALDDPSSPADVRPIPQLKESRVQSTGPQRNPTREPDPQLA